MKTQTGNEIEELEELVVLAETVSGNIEEIKNKQTQSVFLMYIYIIIFIVSISGCVLYFESQSVGFKNEYRTSGLFLFLSVSIGFLMLLIKTMLNRMKISKVIHRERGILKKLLNMIHAYKEVAYQDMSVVKKAIIDMRLNRIKFGA